MQSCTGILGIGDQDHAVIESMGAIYDRTQEHLGTSDLMVIRMRRLLLKAAHELREHGTPPPGVDDPEVYRRAPAASCCQTASTAWRPRETCSAASKRVRPFHERHAMAPMVENHGVLTQCTPALRPGLRTNRQHTPTAEAFQPCRRVSGMCFANDAEAGKPRLRSYGTAVGDTALGGVAGGTVSFTARTVRLSPFVLVTMTCSPSAILRPSAWRTMSLPSRAPCRQAKDWSVPGPSHR